MCVSVVLVIMNKQCDFTRTRQYFDAARWVKSSYNNFHWKKWTKTKL